MFCDWGLLGGWHLFGGFSGTVLLLLLAGSVTLLVLRKKEKTSHGIFCRSCGKEVEAAFLRCPRCGAILKDHCPKCSRLLENIWQHCPHCGETINNQARPSQNKV